MCQTDFVLNDSCYLHNFYSLFNVGQVTSIPYSGGPNSFIRGLANDSALTFDPTFSDDLRNFLNRPNNQGNFQFKFTLHHFELNVVVDFKTQKVRSDQCMDRE